MTVPGPLVWDALLSEENLRLAWRRAVRYFATSTHFVDQIAVAAFGRDIDANLARIRDDFATGRYRLTPLRLTPHPKPRRGRTASIIMREIFWLHPRDQVAWLAVINVIGPGLDDQMPDWSYGHRLREGAGRRSVVPDDETARDQLLWAPGQGWPIFQRHVLLTARHLRDGRIDPDGLKPEDRQVWQIEMNRPPAHRLGYWQTPALCGGPVYHVALDFKSFSGSIGLAQVLQGLRTHCAAVVQDARLADLIDGLLAFEVDLAEDLPFWAVCEPAARPGRLDHAPMGLIVQGFLNNISMLPIDTMAARLLADRPIAQFRFVDDQVMLSTDIDQLVDWLGRYRAIVHAHIPTLEINRHKLKPAALLPWFDDAAPAQAAALPSSDPAVVRAALFDPDDPGKLWHPVPVRLEPPGKFSARLNATDLSEESFRTIAARLSGAEIPAIPRMPPGPYEPVAADWTLEASIFARALNMMRDFRDRAPLLRAALLYLARTGFPGFGQISNDLVAFEAQFPAAALSARSLLLQTLAPIVPAAALDLVRVGQSEKRRAAALGFLLDLAALDPSWLSRPSAWHVERSWRNFCHGLTTARAVLPEGETGLPLDHVRAIMDALLSPSLADPSAVRRSRQDALVWLHWFADFPASQICGPRGDVAV
jgi:hypothetical protein